MTKTPHIEMTLLIPNQAQKELILNESLLRIDILMRGVAIELNVNNPPETQPENGDTYVIGENPCHIWQDYNNHIVYYFQGWRYLMPKAGMSLFILKEKSIYRFLDNAWIKE